MTLIKGRGVRSKMQGDLPCPVALTMILDDKHPVGEAISNVAAPFRVRIDTRALACSYVNDTSSELMKLKES